MTQGLSKSLGVFRGTALLLNIVIGAGLLTLPGLAVKQLGDLAFASWVVCALSALPLLVVFIVLGRRYPDAGGITAYAFRAFGAYGRNAATALFLGAVSLGLPAIALTGGHYIAASVGGNAHLYGVGLIICAVGLHFLPGEGAAKAMAWIASAIIGSVVIFLIIGALGLSGLATFRPIAIPPIDRVLSFGSSFMMLFFAFTGWEVGAGIGEEFHEPKFQFPAAMLISFGLATALYLSSAFIAQNVVLSGFYEAPFVAMTRPVLGAHAADIVAIVASLIIFANLAGAVWGVSRLVFSLARDGIAPALFAVTLRGKPVPAVAATSTVLIIILALDASGFLGLEKMLAVAGQNFLIIYGIAAAALTALAKRAWERGLGLAVIAFTAFLIIQNGETLKYPLTLVACAAALTLAHRLWFAADQVESGVSG